MEFAWYASSGIVRPSDMSLSYLENAKAYVRRRIRARRFDGPYTKEYLWRAYIAFGRELKRREGSKCSEYFRR
jgi:hypothetical protein